MADGDKWDYDPDTGRPVDPNHPWNRPAEDAASFADRVFAREIRSCEQALKAGNFAALLKAVGLCRRFNKPLPEWAATDVQANLSQLYQGLAPRTRGRTGNPRAKDRQNRIHYERWAAVEELRERWDEIGGFDECPSLETAFAAVSDLLSGNYAEGSEEVIKKSYQLVVRQMKAGKGPLFYITQQGKNSPNFWP